MRIIERKRILEKSELAPGEAALDIETAGLVRDRDAVYIIGMVFAERDYDTFVQLAILSERDEPELLAEAARLLAGRTVVTYNGDAFDLPYLAHRAAKLHVPWPELESRDLYRILRSKKKFLDVPNLKLKTLEQLIGIRRLDALSGTEVAEGLGRVGKGLDDIEPYLLHNAEDVVNTARLIEAFTRVMLPLTGRWQSRDVLFRLESYKRTRDFSTVSYSALSPFGAPYRYEDPFARVSWSDDSLELRVPCHVGSFEDRTLEVAVVPGGTDASPYRLKAPLLCLSDGARNMTGNLISLASLTLERAVEGKHGTI